MKVVDQMIFKHRMWYISENKFKTELQTPVRVNTLMDSRWDAYSAAWVYSHEIAIPFFRVREWRWRRK